MQTVRIILELLYFISGPLVAVFAFIGLRQLQIAKENARMSAMRESYKLAADQCAFFHHTVTPALHTLDDALDEKKITFLKNSKVEIQGNSLKINYPKKQKPAELVPVSVEMATALNSLDSFSVFFTSGVAAESVAFNAVGNTYCNSVRTLLPILVFLNEGGTNYSSIIQLFLMWNSRLEGRRLLSELGETEAKLKKLDNKTIKPVGT